MTHTEIDKREIKALRLTGNRLREARVLCKLILPEAAVILECDRKYLTDIEHFRKNDAIPLNFLIRASYAYQVSVDYLLGISEDWEISNEIKNERDIVHGLHKANTAQLAELVVENAFYHRQLEGLGEIIKAITDNFIQTESVLARFIELNPDFIDMRGGSPLLSHVEGLKPLAIQLSVRCKWLKLPPFSQDFYRRGYMDSKTNC